MISLKLQQLPDRLPVKLTVTLTPELKKALDDYAKVYARTYGAEEPVAELVPFMIESFLKADAAFKKSRKELEAEPLALPLATRRTRLKRATANGTEGEGA